MNIQLLLDFTESDSEKVLGGYSLQHNQYPEIVSSCETLRLHRLIMLNKVKENECPKNLETI